MAFFTGKLQLKFTGSKSQPGLGILFNRDDIARCTQCWIGVQLKNGQIECPSCHRWRSTKIERKAE